MLNHTDQFIDEMKVALLRERKQLEAELGTIAHRHEGVFAADRPDYGRQDEDNATEIADLSALSAAASAASERLHDIDEALHRMEKGSYGLSEDGTLIPEERLRANPAARNVAKR